MLTFTKLAFTQSSLDSLRLVLPIGHQSSIYSAKFSPNGKLIVTASSDKTFRIWDAKTGKLLNIFEGHKAAVSSVNFSPDSKLILSTSKFYLAELFLWDVNNGQLIKKLEGHKIIKEAKFSKDGTKIISIGGYDGNIGDDATVKIWDAKTYKLILDLNSHSRALTSVNFSSDGKLFVTTSMDHSAKIFSISSGKLMQTLIGHTQQVDFAMFSPDGRTVITKAQDNIVIIWNVATGKAIHFIKGHNKGIDYTDISPDGKTLVTSSWRENSTKVWDISSGKLLKNFNGKFLIYNSMSNDKSIIKNNFFIYDAISGNILDVYSGNLLGIKNLIYNNIEVNCTALFSPDGDRILVTGSEYKQMNKEKMIWDFVEVFSFTTGKNLFNLQSKTINVFSNNSTFNGDKIITLGRGKNSIGRINNCISCVNNIATLDFKSGRLINSIKLVDKISNYNFSENNDSKGKIISQLSDTTIRIWDFVSRKEIYKITWNKSKWGEPRITSTSFSPDGKKILTTHNDFTAALWDAQNGKLLHYIDGGHSTNYVKAIFSPNGKSLLTISSDAAFLWDIFSGNLLFTLNGAKSINAKTAKFSPNGDYVILTSEYLNQGEVFIFNSMNGELLKNFDAGVNRSINSAEFSSDGKYIIASCYDDKSRVWDFQSSKLLSTIEGGRYSAFSPDNNHIITISKNIKIWDIKTFKLLKGIDCDSIYPNLYLNKANFNYKGNVVCLSSELDQSAPLIILDVLTGEKISYLDYSLIGFRYGENLNFSRDGKFVITSAGDSKTIIWNSDSRKAIYEIILFENNDWIIRLSNTPYYMCSKNASKLLHYVTPSLKIIGFDQLDPIYNRPDIVLDSIGKAIGFNNIETSKEYFYAWQKRINLLGLDTKILGKGEIAVPNAEIVNADKIEYKNNSGKLTFKINAYDLKYTLRRFNVYINEVPIYGSAGISIAQLKKQKWDTTLSVPLSVGENKIQVSVMNELGLENFKYPSYVNYTPTEIITAKTYYIGIGVNEFKESNHNLKYCVKDVSDLAKSFGGQNTVVKLFTNEQVKKENILALKDYLSKTSVNDKVIISCSSHGLLDDSLNFYLAMHDVDFNNPKVRGLKYEELENLLDGIPARQKLLLLDACNSGENDKTDLLKKELKEVEKQKENEDLIAYKGKTRSLILTLEDENTNKFRKVNELFVNVRNNTGSVIISAAGGQQSALEAIEVDGKIIKNGAFTFCVLEYLNNHNNEKEELTVNKLKQYVEGRVEEITKGKQEPTSRQETMEVDWQLKQ